MDAVVEAVQWRRAVSRRGARQYAGAARPRHTSPAATRHSPLDSRATKLIAELPLLAQVTCATARCSKVLRYKVQCECRCGSARQSAGVGTRGRSRRRLTTTVLVKI